MTGHVTFLWRCSVRVTYFIYGDKPLFGNIILLRYFKYYRDKHLQEFCDFSHFLCYKVNLGVSRGKMTFLEILETLKLTKIK